MTRHWYARWAEVSELPENQILRLADIGARQSHYVYARQYPDHYPGHCGGSAVCPHSDCRAVIIAIKKAVTDAQTKR